MNKSIFTHKFSRIRSRMPLWAQLVVMLTFVTTVLLSFILVRDYQNNRRSIIERQISTSGRLLDLELQNLDQYVKELTSFCLQPLYDSDFSRILSEKDPIAASDETVVTIVAPTSTHSMMQHAFRIRFCGLRDVFGATGVR